MAEAFPDELTLALRELAAGRSRKALATRSGHISEQYRERVPSARHVMAEDDALAYALARMPATFAAVSSVLTEARALVGDFAPRTLLDAGAGPGTASWAACGLWPDMAGITMLDHNERFLSLAASLAGLGSHAALKASRTVRGDLTGTGGEGPYDLVTLGYALTELADERVGPVVNALWARTGGVLVIVEPGRPREYRRLMQARSQLIGEGARIAAPCPHDEPCPLAGDDWCHFAVRLARSRDHQALKGASLGYEDEKFSYLVAVRPGLEIERGWSRVIKPAQISKFSIGLPLCTGSGLADRHVMKRDADAFRHVRNRDWGDRLDEAGA